MMATASIMIERSIEEVFAFVSNIENMPRWVSGVNKARLLSDKMGAGARYFANYVHDGLPAKIEFEVEEFDPPRRFVARTARGPFAFPFRGTLEFRAINGSTEVINNIETGPESLASRVAALLFGPLLRRSVRRRLERELEQLKVSMLGGAPQAA